MAVFGAVGAAAMSEAVEELSQSQPASVLTSGGPAQSQQSPAGYLFVAPLSVLAGKTFAYFHHPTQGVCILVDYGGQWRAFSAICTHAGCTVQFTGSQIYCPCHSGSFSPVNGSVLGGPPPSQLPELVVRAQGGNLYVAQ